MFLRIEEIESMTFEGHCCRPGTLDGVIQDKCTCIKDREIRNNVAENGATGGCELSNHSGCGVRNYM